MPSEQKIFAQIFSGPGRQGSSDLGATQPVSASPIPWETQLHKMVNGSTNMRVIEGAIRIAGYHGKIPSLQDEPEEFLEFVKKIPMLHLMGETPREITREEIKALVKDMGKGVGIAKLCGYDGVCIHACHGYLVHSFISERSNFRRDEYGGSLENRLRFLLELLRSARRVAGPDYPVGVRFSASEELPGGYDPHVAARIAQRCEEEGADFIDLSDGSYEAMDDFLPNREGQVMEKAAIIRGQVRIPVICPSVHDPDNVLEMIEKGKSDLVSQGRQQICDPDWVNKVREGRLDEIIKCTRCNQGCIIRFVAMLPVRCVRNPIVGQEEFMEEYMNRPIIPVKESVWQSGPDFYRGEPSEYWEYTEDEFRELMEAQA